MRWKRNNHFKNQQSNMKIIAELETPEVKNKKQFAKKAGMSLTGVYRTLKGDYCATPKFLKALWGKERYAMWITYLHLWR